MGRNHCEILHKSQQYEQTKCRRSLASHTKTTQVLTGHIQKAFSVVLEATSCWFFTGQFVAVAAGDEAINGSDKKSRETPNCNVCGGT